NSRRISPVPPALAALGCLLFIAYLFRTHFVRSPATCISWLPFVWMFIAGSRFVSHWLNLRPAATGGDPYAEGSPVDRALFLALIVCGCFVLYRRQVNWRRLFLQNKWLIAYFAFCLCSILWTEEPYILAKRWIKDLGNPIMALILLTEPLAYDS